ncbi:BTAD domain-containing putative transcriptional regulator [Streptomyces bacillaris]|uniref:AfsR/SARP family transcriptional regulator n=1 Tax=Streptomyces bacillaris TaxID=68179 RepID=UPI00382DBAB3
MSSEKAGFVVLGPVGAWLGPVEVKLGGPQQRVVMAVLLLRRPFPVSPEDLVAAVWGERPPPSAVNQLRIYVHRLRRALEEAGPASEPLIESVGSGYRLRIADGSLDLAVFQEKVSAAQRVRRTDAVRAGELLREALALWQGGALAGLPGAWAQAQRVRLEQGRLDALECAYRVGLDTGSHDDITAGLSQVVAEHPLDERFREVLMLALYRSGRQAAALEVYARTRALLAEELGIEPGPELRRLHERILRADTRLLAPAGAESPATGGRGPVPGGASPATRGTGSGPAGADLAAAGAGPGSGGTGSGSGGAGAVTGTAAVAAVRERSGPTTGRAPVVPAQLPYDLPVFSGRRRELAELSDVAEAGRDGGTGTVLCVVAGSAGVGKTAFAVHAAHGLARDYPDGQIHLDLHGFDAHESPVPPRRALRSVLEAFGVPADRLPDDVDARAALYRSLLAGRRVLILLDNARDSRQVRRLLPSSPGSLTIVTSRDQLSGLVVRNGAHHLRLEALSAAEAHDLLVRRLGAACVDADPAATALIVERTAGLPLALALVAARAATRRVTTLTGIAAELREVPVTLDALSSADSSLDVRSVFSWSYEALSPGAARLHRLSSLTPAPGCSATALAALAGLPVPRTRTLLDELTAAHLMDEPEAGRFVSHDLLREYAAELLAAHEGADAPAAAFRRMLAHYLGTAYTAARTLWVNLPPLELHPEAAGAPVADVADGERASAWFAAESESLPHLVERAGAAEGCETQTWQLAWSLMDHLQREGRWDEQIATQRTALDAASRAGDRVGRAQALRNLARACAQAGRLDEAQHHLTDALEAFGELGDLVGQARSHGNLALVLTRRGEHAAALPHVHRAVEQFRAAGDRVGQANALNNLGWTYAGTGAFPEALRYCRQALDLLRDAGDRVAEAATWDSLGYVHHRLGDHTRALDCYRRALDLDRQLGDDYNAADTLTHLGETKLAMGDPAGAEEAWNTALPVFDDLDPEAAGRVRELLAGLGAGKPARAAVASGPAVGAQGV